MSYFFDAEEIFHTAILIEQNGEKFYQALLNETKDEAVKKVCRRLADDEKRHAANFIRLLKEAVGRKPAVFTGTDVGEEDVKYIKSLTDANVFARTLSVKEVAAKIRTDQETIRFALKIEKESVVFYASIKKFVKPGPGKDEIDEIIQEEQEHYRILNELLESKINPRETC